MTDGETLDRRIGASSRAVDEGFRALQRLAFQAPLQPVGEVDARVLAVGHRGRVAKAVLQGRIILRPAF